MLFGGIDGGQSSTVAVVLDGEGALLGRGVAGPADHIDEPADSRRAADACERALAAALAAAGLEPGTPLEAVAIGLSGFDQEWYGVEPRFTSGHVRYGHDAPIALAGATEERPAAVVIAGTGSVGYGETMAGRAVTVGGHGYLFGDEGSSFAIARTALAAAMRVADRGETTDLGLAAMAFFDVPDLPALARGFGLHQISRSRLASFARVVHDAARLGDDEARGIVEGAAGALAALGVLAVERLGGSEEIPVSVAFVGGALANADLRAATHSRFEAAAPNGRVIAARYEPAVGAALRAFDAAGRPRPTAVSAPAPP